MKYIELKNQINSPIFDLQMLRLRKLNVFKYQLSSWQNKGYIEQVKRGLYVFCDRKSEISGEEISFLLYQPSYLSLEYALSHYSFIPEIVFGYTAVTAKTTRRFQNGYGNFIYRHLKPSLFFGYIPYQTPHGKYLLAEPEKALLDYCYLNLSQLNSRNDILELRLNCDSLRQSIDNEKLRLYLENYKSRKLERIVREVAKLCSLTNK